MISATMKRRFIFLFLLIFLVVVGLSIVKSVSNRNPKKGELRIESQPVGSIFIDNKHLGRTPYRDKITTGEYVVKIIPESVVGTGGSWEGKVKIGPNSLTFINASLSESELTSAADVLWLEKVSGNKPELAVLTNPDGATIMLDNETKGAAPLILSNLSPGDHTLTIISSGFVSRTIKVKLTPGFKLISSIKLALSTGSGLISEASPSAQPSGTITPTPKVTGKTTPSPTVPDPAKPFVVIKDTPTGFLRVRMEPSTNATEAARVKPGEKYSLLDTKTGWYQISYETNKEGWVASQYADKIE